ncbi:MAG: DNA polymerase beta superfamily protein [Eggerthellaceae bacterium]
MRLDDPRDVIEWKLDNVLDISGWDIQRTLRLMRESNQCPTLSREDPLG